MRYLPLTTQNRKDMLQAVGAKSVDALYNAVPEGARMKEPANLPPHKGELEIERIMGGYAGQNRSAADGPFFLGAGCYYHHIPATVDYIIQRSEFMTAYTPYQPEIAQGTLQVIFEFQSMIAQLTGQDVANASMYDGATAMTEAVLMAMRITKREKIFFASSINYDYVSVLNTYLRHSGIGHIATPNEISARGGVQPDAETACVIVQCPDFNGDIFGYQKLREECDKAGALLIVVVTEILSLGLLPAPAEADIVCGEAQSIGIPMSFGGPHLGFFACREKYLRQMPGRLCGETVDADGQRGFVLTLSTREQHIRREKATSNICTNQGLCALAFTVHMALLGEDGFKRLARLNHERACKLADALSEIKGVHVLNKTFFNEFRIRLDLREENGDEAIGRIYSALMERGICAGKVLNWNQILVAATEMTTDEDIAAFASALQEAMHAHA